MCVGCSRHSRRGEPEHRAGTHPGKQAHWQAGRQGLTANPRLWAPTVVAGRHQPPVRPPCRMYPPSQSASQSLPLVRQSTKEEVQRSKKAAGTHHSLHEGAAAAAAGQRLHQKVLLPTDRRGNFRGNVALLASAGLLGLAPQRPTGFSSSNSQG